MITSKTNMATNQDYYSQILSTWHGKLKLKVLFGDFSKNKEFSIVVINLLSQNITMIQTH